MHDPNPDLSFPETAAPPNTGNGVVRQFVLSAIVGAALLLGLTFRLTGLSFPAMMLAFAGYGIGVALAIGLLRRGFPHETLGLCNGVTLTRLVLSAALLAPLAHQAAATWTVFGVATIALILDGVDGWLARREGRASGFGARFDMEVDAALGLILALNVWAAGTVGAYVLLIGLPRYVFVAAAIPWPWLDRPTPERFSRKAVCVLQIGALIALQLPVFPDSLATALVALVAAALFWSFGRDVAWLWRHRT